MASDISSSSHLNPSADSYIGCLVSLTSKSEIRYEGVIVSIDTNESTITLRNVRSFGTEGRRKGGLQVAPRENIYEHVVFRGSDIKDLQVKTSISFAKPPDYNGPTVVQSHCGTSSVTSMAASRAWTDAGSSLANRAFVKPLTHGKLEACGSTIDTMPVIPQLFAARQSEFDRAVNAPQYQEWCYQPVTSGKTLPNLQRHLQSPVDQTSVNSNFPAYSKASSSLVSSPEISSQFTNSDFIDVVAFPHSMTSNFFHAPSLDHPSLSQAMAKLQVSSDYSLATPALSMPDNQVQPRAIASSSPQAIVEMDDREIILPLSPKLYPSLSTLPQAPPLHPPVPFQQIYESRQLQLRTLFGLRTHAVTPLLSSLRLRSDASSHLSPQQSGSLFDEEFDFSAMNEKFNKDEIWGTLGKAKRSVDKSEREKNQIGGMVSAKGGPEDASIYDKKTVYNKDEFFDTLSCDSLNHDGWSRRSKFSNRVKYDTKTSGNIQHSSSFGHGHFEAHHGDYRGGYYNRSWGYGNRGGRDDHGYLP